MRPGLAHNSLHGTINLLRGHAVVVHRKFDEQEVRLVIQNVMLETKYAEIRAGSTNGCVYLAHPGIGELLSKPLECFWAPAFLRRDASAQVSKTQFGPGFQL